MTGLPTGRLRIEHISRFVSGKKQSAAKANLSDGSIDIVIGTHKLLSADIRFKNLGLVVVDEEQRFGVRQKEILKKMRAEVDVLTLTATPIPRTLNMSLSGLRDLSIIATPPSHRHAIKTFVGTWDTHTIREACLRELKRGGQIFLLHNEVRSIEKTAREIRQLLPDTAVGGRTWPDARTGPGAGHGRFLPSALQRPGMHDHHRKRH